MNFNKVFAVAVLSALCFSSCTTTIPAVGQAQSLQRIVDFYIAGDSAQVPITKSILFDKANSCVARIYKSSNTVVQLRDRDNGQLIIQALGAPPMDFGIQRGFTYTLILDFKDGKMRVQYENITTHNIGDVAGANMAYQWNEVSQYLNSLTNTLVIEMNKTQKDNW